MMLMVREGATEVTSSKMVPARFIAGQATSLDLGGTGRAVTGRLAPPKGSQDRPLWNFALVNLRADLPTPKSPPIPADVENQPERQKAWWNQWKTTAEGKAWQAAQDTFHKLLSRSPHFTASIDREGSFRIDDVPPGKYLLDVQFHEHRAGYLSGYQLSVPEAGIAEAGRPLELGVLALQRP